MSIYATSEIYILASSAIIGIALGFIFEIFRFIRAIGFKKTNAVFIQDVLFMLISGQIVFIFTFWVNEGVMRSYELIGIAAGFSIYYFTLGHIIFIFYGHIIRLTCKFFMFLYKNTALRAYIALDKFYKSGKIFIEERNARALERKIYKSALTGFRKL